MRKPSTGALLLATEVLAEQAGEWDPECKSASDLRAVVDWIKAVMDRAEQANMIAAVSRKTGAPPSKVRAYLRDHA